MLKKLILPAILLTIGIIAAKKHSKPPMLGEKAPAFIAKSTQGTIDFPKQYDDSWVVLFSHASDFTPVCTTELMSFQAAYPDFIELNTELLGLSVDSIDRHKSWLQNIKDRVEFEGYYKIDIRFPIIDDSNKKIAKKYGMIQPKISESNTIRSVFIIDPKGTIRAILHYPPSSGRNLEEIKRLLIALKTSDEFNVVTPANWELGKDVLIPLPSSHEETYFRAENPKLKCHNWFLCFKNLPKDTIKEKLFFN